MVDENFLQEITKLEDEFKTLLDLNDDSWSSYVEKENYCIRTCQRDYNSNYTFRLDFGVESSIESVWDAIGPDQLCKWDDSVESVKLLKLLSDTAKIEHVTQKPMFAGALSVRDFINLAVRVEESSGNKYLAYQSIDNNEEYPEEEGVVRGINYPSGFYLTKVEGENCTKVTLIYQADHKVWAPWIAINTNISYALNALVDNLKKFTHA